MSTFGRTLVLISSLKYGSALVVLKKENLFSQAFKQYEYVRYMKTPLFEQILTSWNREASLQKQSFFNFWKFQKKNLTSFMNKQSEINWPQYPMRTWKIAETAMAPWNIFFNFLIFKLPPTGKKIKNEQDTVLHYS